MGDLIRFQDLQRELEQETIVQRESRAEEQAAIVLTRKTYTDLFSDDWVSYARKVTAQYSQWIKSEVAPDPEDLALCINVPSLSRQFRDYVRSRAASEEKQRDWERAFSDPSFQRSVQMFLYQKVFERKNDLVISSGKRGFLTRIAFEYHLRQYEEKSKRSIYHEALNKLRKTHGEELPPQEMLDFVESWLEKRFAEQEDKIIRMLGSLRFPGTPERDQEGMRIGNPSV